ncbi:MAG: hypothetical protein AB1782_12385 [Cyanobacteriota bacterium]
MSESTNKEVNKKEEKNTPKLPPLKPIPVETFKAYYALNLYAKPILPYSLIA